MIAKVNCQAAIFLTWSFILAFLIFNGSILFGQSLGGVVTNETGIALPHVNIYIKQLQSGTSTDEQGRYFIALDPGHYEVVYSSLGYESRVIPVIVFDSLNQVNVRLNLSDLKLDEILVQAKQKDAAYEIIQNVIRHKKKFLRDLQSSRCDVYIKATEAISEKEKMRRKSIQVSVESTDPAKDPFSEESTVGKDPRASINMMEVLLELNFQSPGKYKEIRSGYKVYGSRAGLFVPRFSEIDFNFYRNLVVMPGLTDGPIISPVSSTAILTYRYKLEASEWEDGLLVHRIRVSPRKSGNASCSGYIYINEGVWSINRIDLDLPRGGLKFYDSFRLKQRYTLIQDSLWLVNRQEFLYETKQGNRKTFRGSTLINYKNILPNFNFPEKFFNAEVSITTREALERDSIYWHHRRTEPFDSIQEQVASYRDSIERNHQSDAYLDSTQQAYNKITTGEVLWHGVGFRNNFKKSDLYLNSVLDLIGFEIIGGLRIGPYANYFRRWESGRMMRTSGNFSLGVKNTDAQGHFNFWTRYDPRRLSDFSFSMGRGFQSINSFDAYLNQLKRSNYILRNHMSVYHRSELFNGFYLQTELSFNARKSVEDYQSETFIEDLIDDEVPLSFENYEAFTSGLRLTYTPVQKYMSEPNRKVVLGSDFPTFELLYRKGWHGVLGSDINWDYLELGATQDIVLGIFGNSKYTMRLGNFINTKNVPYVDLLRFRQSDPILYSSPLQSFQTLDTSLSTTGLFFEAHHIHHFNGALMNNIPFIKKLGLRLAIGGGYLYIKSNKFRQQEIFGGVERIFKLGVRRRMRIGIFGVLGDSNFAKPSTGFKISFDIIDTWKQDWSH